VEGTVTGALDGRTAVVTGGGRGIGAGIALALAEAGARVAIVGRNADSLAEVAAAATGEITAITADLADPAAPASVADRAFNALGDVDVLVNNAGVGDSATVADYTPAGIDAVLALNVRAPLLLSGLFGRRMADRGAGSIVNVSSALAGLGMPANAVYAASKGALDAATRALAAELGPKGVRVNTIRPAVTRSDMSDAIVSDAAVAKAYLEGVAVKRFGEPSDIGAAVVFLASDGAAYLTGQVIDVDGGWSTTARSIFSGG
jgi:NAD(P)-dependent dehydrogenase (short-subunit alcohol dehydrogenase family)